MSQVFEVSSSGYYAYFKREVSGIAAKMRCKFKRTTKADPKAMVAIT